MIIPPKKFRPRFSASDEAVLKLVHPGRHVETYRKPVTAAEIMRKNPRHIVARPDVFKYPWIVVKPEAVLVPGKVFYIVPYHTMVKLLKAKGNKPPSDQQNLSVDDFTDDHYHGYEDHGDYDCTNSALQESAGTTPKHVGHDRYHRRRITPPKRVHPEVHRRQCTPPRRTRSQVHSDDNVGPSYARSRKGVKASKNKNGYLVPCQRSPVDRNRSNATPAARNGHRHLELKSCLRKEGSSRGSLRLNVTFGSPIIIPASPRKSAQN